MTWQSRIDGEPEKQDTILLAPLMMCLRQDIWGPILDGAIDSYTSDPLTLDLLADLIRHLNAKVVLEVGTYRGWGTFTMAEALRLQEQNPGHLWTCDPVDYEVQEVLDKTGLAPFVSYHHGPLETLLPDVPGDIDLCYIDASHPEEENLRLRYFGLVLPKMRVGGLIVMDDIDHGWSGAVVMQQLGIVLPHHRGLAIVQKR